MCSNSLCFPVLDFQRLDRTQEVVGSSPTSSIVEKPRRGGAAGFMALEDASDRSVRVLVINHYCLIGENGAEQEGSVVSGQPADRRSVRRGCLKPAEPNLPAA